MLRFVKCTAWCKGIHARSFVKFDMLLPFATYIFGSKLPHAWDKHYNILSLNIWFWGAFRRIGFHGTTVTSPIFHSFSDHPVFSENGIAFQTFPASLKICFGAHFGIALGPSSASPKITFRTGFRTTLASSKTAFRTKFSDLRFLRKLLFGHLWKQFRTSLASPKTALRTKVSDHPRLLRKLLFGQVFGPPWLLRKRLFGPNFRTSGFSENCFSDTFGNIVSDQLGLSENSSSDQGFGPSSASPKIAFRAGCRSTLLASSKTAFRTKFSDLRFLGSTALGFSDHIFGPPRTPTVSPKIAFRTWFRISLVSPKTAFSSKFSNPLSLRKCIFGTYWRTALSRKLIFGPRRQVFSEDVCDLMNVELSELQSNFLGQTNRKSSAKKPQTERKKAQTGAIWKSARFRSWNLAFSQPYMSESRGITCTCMVHYIGSTLAQQFSGINMSKETLDHGLNLLRVASTESTLTLDAEIKARLI